ncbi:hypothetical protein INS49_015801 [Diaporthe citri]|uniref:uncharacterized protein n=1 Tax=Diaporthe citri TaxID=83186 RepID=UPI001C821DAC|nr:uncharacterized protein INS49_015801 [Diaporthe citri]KAG6356413.1 hypothetical protein INS49_015801 [Diaporthe citri]
MDEDELALVSSLYGKGTTVCWLFTILACLILWTCDKRKRRSDTLDADFIGILALPSVAAGHTIYQIRCLKSLTFSDIKPVKIKQISRAIEASLTVTETFMILSVVLFLVAFPARCYKRAVLIALTGLFCLATEYVVYSQLTRSPSQHLSTIRASFTRSFVSDSAIITAVILALILACIAIAFCLALYVFYSTPLQPLEANPEETATFARTMLEIEALHTPEAIFREIRRNRTRHASREDRFVYLSFWIALIPLVASVGTTNMSIFIGVQSLGAKTPESSDWWSGLGHAIQRFLAAFFPKTAAGLGDLDQAVALATGCVILALSLWSVGRKWYVEWKLEREARLREQRAEDIRLTELRRRLAVLVQEAQ